MSEEFMAIAENCVHDLLLWVGFGTLVGLAAKAIMPGRDPGGAVATLMMGIAGSVIGCGVTLLFWEGAKITPISVPGFLAGTAGAFMLLFFYKLLAGTYFSEAEDGERWWHYSRRRRRRRSLANDTY
ncbi:MAG TPA: GlsB/YeaQ/YmgE family stress response membrane protein [Planctomycetaceae bacterium]|nr:GlsB/YeaQ/YmgE family stress response membrane protein [Planctomycetaceae bacterium]